MKPGSDQTLDHIAGGRDIVGGLTSIIIPTCNRKALLEGLIDSVLQALSPAVASVELLIIDNNSDEPAALELLDALPGLAYSTSAVAVRVLRYPRPFNYAAINNFAVQQAHGEFLCFLNNDMQVISARWLQAMLGTMAEPSTGCVGGRLLYADDTIQHAGVVVGVETVAGHIYKHAPADLEGHDGFLRQIRPVSAVTGACLLIRRSVFESVDGFDEQLAVSFNDVDLCLRVEREGYRNLVVPEATLYHFESRSRGTRSSRTRAQRRRHRDEVIYMQRKWGVRLLGLAEELAHWSEAQRVLRERLAGPMKQHRPGLIRRRKAAAHDGSDALR